MQAFLNDSLHEEKRTGTLNVRLPLTHSAKHDRHYSEIIFTLTGRNVLICRISCLRFQRVNLEQTKQKELDTEIIKYNGKLTGITAKNET